MEIEERKRKKKESARRYYLKNRDNIIKKVKEYRLIHKEHLSKKKYERKKQRLRNDEVFYLKQQMNNLIYYSFNRKRKYRKTSKATKIFCCDWETFYNHLLKTFKENYGCEWNENIKVQVDHIIPMNEAKTIDKVIELNHYTNLQLLKPKDNSNKYIKLDWKLEKGEIKNE